MTDTQRLKSKGIQSVKVSGSIMQALSNFPSPLSLGTLTKLVNLQPGQCHAYLTSLKKTNLVEQDSESGLYTVGAFAMELGVAWLKSDPIAISTIELTKKISERSGLMSLVSIWGKNGPTIIHMNEGSKPMALNIRQGTTFSVTGSATGNIFAAFEPTRSKNLVTRELTNRSDFSHSFDTTNSQFWKRIERVRKFRIATTEGNPIPGINAIAIPIMRSGGGLHFVCTLVGFSHDLKVDKNSWHFKNMKSALEEAEQWRER